jgi:sugar lactone lactonase YvrE
MYLIDSLAGGVDAFSHMQETGMLSNRRRFVSLAENEGLMDGMTVDSDGYLWIANYRGGAVRRYSADGALELMVELPVSQPTSAHSVGQIWLIST